MFCWNCGQRNSAENKFCGQCGRSLHTPGSAKESPGNPDATPVPLSNFLKPELMNAKGAREPHPLLIERTPFDNLDSLSRRKSDDSALSQSDMDSAESESPTKSGVPLKRIEAAAVTMPATNPLIEEPRIVHQDPIATASQSVTKPLVAKGPPVNRINGPSFLGLSDEPSSSIDGDYLLYDDGTANSGFRWPSYAAIALLLIVGLLVVRNWNSLRGAATDYAQRWGISDPIRHSAEPARVTDSADSQSPAAATPDAAPVESKNEAPAAVEKKQPQSQEQSEPVQTAKLEKPESDAGPSESRIETTKPRAAKAATPTPVVYDNSQLELAQKYLQGRGVAQDCNRGVELLRNAAQQPNPKARIQMGALYSSGHCVSQDLAQAYKWFAQAKQIEPHNMWLEKNLDLLWAKMSDQERRRVVR